MSQYLIDPPQLRRERVEPFRCHCHRLKNKQHREPWQCLSDADMLPFLAANPEVNALSPRVRIWAWLDYEFTR